MAIVRVYDAQGWSLDQYDQVIEKLAAGGPFEGVLFHAAGASIDGVRVVEAYESVEAADKFIQERVAPAATDLGLSLPQQQGFTVHNSQGLQGA